jgi:hypothetical protein
MKKFKNFKTFEFLKLLIFSLVLALIPKITYPQDNMADFLKFSIGARPLSMGSTYVAVEPDINSIYFNPAGISLINLGQIQTMYSNLSEFDTKANYLCYVQPVSYIGTLGLGLVQIKTENIPQTIDDGTGRPLILNYFDIKKTAFLLSYGKLINNKTSIGLNIKYLKQDIDNSEGFGVDLGILYKLNKTNLGLNIQNATKTKLKDKIPLNLKLGIASYFLEDKLLIALDIDKTKKQKNKISYR